MRSQSPLKIPKFKMSAGVDTDWAGGTVQVFPMGAYDWANRVIRREARVPLLWTVGNVAFLNGLSYEDYALLADQVTPKKASPIRVVKALFYNTGFSTIEPSMDKLKGFFVTGSVPPIGSSALEIVVPRTGIRESTDTNNVITITGIHIADHEVSFDFGVSPQPVQLYLNTADPDQWDGGELLAIMTVNSTSSGGPFSSSNLLNLGPRAWKTQCSPHSDYISKVRDQFEEMAPVYSKLKVVIISSGDLVVAPDGPYPDDDSRLTATFGAAASNSLTVENMDVARGACSGLTGVDYFDIGQYEANEGGDTARAASTQAIIDDAINEFVQV